MNFLPYEEQETLEAICRYHGITDPKAIEHLAQFGVWIHEYEQAKQRFGPPRGGPTNLLSFLSLLGIYGKDALKPAKTEFKLDPPPPGAID